MILVELAPQAHSNNIPAYFVETTSSKRAQSA